jgi:hypothetical protein
MSVLCSRVLFFSATIALQALLAVGMMLVIRKLPALDSKAAIRERREKEIQMKVVARAGSFCLGSVLAYAFAGPAAEEKIIGAKSYFYSFSIGDIKAAARISECST